MTDESEQVACEYCGEMFSPQGVSTHERYCDEKPDEDDEDGTADDADGASVLANSVEDEDELSDIQRAVLNRTDGDCERCGEGYETFHLVREDKPESTRNLFALCRDCDDDLTNLHPHSKRTLVRFDG